MTNPYVVVIAAAVVVGLLWWYQRSRANDRFEAVMARGRSAGTLCSRAQLVDGGNHIPVALTLHGEQINYQSVDFDAALDIATIDEVEYGSDLLTGGIADGAVLRLRSHGRAVEFVLDVTSAEEWSRHLPPHRVNEAGHVHAV